MASSYTEDFTLGMAALLTEAGIGVYRTTPPYTAEETGIALLSMPPGPDRVICLTPYAVDDDVTTDAITGMQIRMRAGTDPLAVLTLADEVLAFLHNRRGYWLGEVHVAVSWRQSEALLGQDAGGRHERASNFYFRTNRPSPYAYE